MKIHFDVLQKLKLTYHLCYFCHPKIFYAPLWFSISGGKYSKAGTTAMYKT